MIIEYTSIAFLRIPTEGKKTEIFQCVRKSSDHVLGHVKWSGVYRRYCFFPAGGSQFDPETLKDIRTFIYEAEGERKEFSRRRKELEE